MCFPTASACRSPGRERGLKYFQRTLHRPAGRTAPWQRAGINWSSPAFPSSGPQQCAEIISGQSPQSKLQKQMDPLGVGGPLCGKEVHSNFRSYSSAAISTTRQEPPLCTSAPVTGVSNSSRESMIAAKLMHTDSAMLNLMVLTVALDSRFR